MTTFEARKDRWGVLFDGMYMKVSDSATAGAYRAIEGNAPVDVIGGARYNKIDAEARIDASLFGGVRATMPINEQWKGIGHADGCGGGSGSDLTWQGMAGLIYACSPSVTINMGYRYMKVDYDDGGFKYDMANDGLHVGVGFRL